jgi:hypothetical protein
MGITDREIIKPSFEASVSGDWKIGLVTLDIKSAAVYTSDAQTLVARCACRKPHGQIGFTGL